MNTDLSAVVGTWLTLAAAAAGLVTGLVGFWHKEGAPGTHLGQELHRVATLRQGLEYGSY